MREYNFKGGMLIEGSSKVEAQTIHWPRVNRSYRLLYNLYDVMLTCQLKPRKFLCSDEYELYEVFKDS